MADHLEENLQALGRTLIVEPPPDDLVERVLAALPASRPGRLRRAWLWLTRSRRRLVAMIVAAVIIALCLTPPVRAVVLHWLRIGGVVIKSVPPAQRGASPTPQPPRPSTQRVTLEQARKLVTFAVGVPAELGRPDRVSVSADRRIVSMDWGSGAQQIHLDQFDGKFSWAYVKTDPGDLHVTRVQGRDAVWFPTAHRIVYVDRDGREHFEQARISAPCLVWERPAASGTVTLRLESQISQQRAVTIAESVG
jgi:hypothetical protein